MLLKRRSILAQAGILVLITLVRSQSYDPDYHISEDGDHSGYSGGEEQQEHQHPDYSKYFSSDVSAPLQGKADAGGFVAPIEFNSFLGTPTFAFGASTNQEVLKPLSAEKKETITGFVNDQDFRGSFTGADSGFGSAPDYFEQAQRQQQQEVENEEETKPGPSYVAHRVPSRKSYETEVDDLKEKPSKYQSPSKNRKSNAQDTIDEIEDRQALNDFATFKPSPSLDLAQFKPTIASQVLDDTTGNLNNPSYYKQFAAAQSNISPYQKFSFQPTQAAATTFEQPSASTFGTNAPFQSTVEPFNPNYLKLASTPATNYEYQPSEIISQNIKGQDCVKINKAISDTNGQFNKQPMNCYVCKDPKSGSKTEQCSYTSEPQSYYQSTTKSYGNRSPDAYRAKREETETYANPYEEIKAKSHEYFSKPSEFEKSFYSTPDLSKINEEYNYNPETFTNKEAEEKSYSEIQSESLAQKGDNCKKSHKNGVTCTVCTNPKTGGSYEQCSYESAPNEKKYAYVKESKYDGDGNPIDEKETDSSNSKPVVERRSDNIETLDEDKEEKSSESDDEKSAKLINEDPYDVPKHFEEATAEQAKLGGGLDPDLYGGSEEENKKPYKYSNLDEYHLKLFPQFAKEETQKSEKRTQPDNPYFEDVEEKKDVEKVLEEFAKKDRSNCRQIRKKGMTCYLCVDKKGIQQEECMFVSESRPKSKHMAYHEVQHLKNPNNSNNSESESIIAPVEAEASETRQKRKGFFKKAPSGAAIDSEGSASDENETRVKFVPSLRRQKRSAKDKREEKSAEKEDPQPQFDVEDEGGLYSAETQPVYSKALGLTLPRYMLEKTEFESEFDRTVAGG